MNVWVLSKRARLYPKAKAVGFSLGTLDKFQDMELVVANFGRTGENKADVKGDGVVNIVDLIKVAGVLGNTVDNL